MGEANGIYKNKDSTYGLQMDQATSSVAHCGLSLSAVSATPEVSWIKPSEISPNKKPAWIEFLVLESGPQPPYPTGTQSWTLP